MLETNQIEKTTACQKKKVIRELTQFCLISAIYKPVTKLFVWHINTTYKRITMSCQTRLKFPFQLRYLSLSWSSLILKKSNNSRDLLVNSDKEAASYLNQQILF